MHIQSTKVSEGNMSKKERPTGNCEQKNDHNLHETMFALKQIVETLQRAMIIPERTQKVHT